jgi:hypothetical protein
MILQLAEGPADSYLRIPNTRGGTDMIHVAAFNNLDDATFERLLDILDPFQNQQDKQLSQDRSRGWRARARQERRRTRQEARQIRQQTRTEGRAAIQQAKAAGIQAGTVKTGGQIIGDVAGKYIETLPAVVGAIAPALVPGAGAASGVGGILGGAAGGIIPRGQQQIQQMPEEEEEKSFLQKYGLWIAGGAAVLVGGYFLLRK